MACVNVGGSKAHAAPGTRRKCMKELDVGRDVSTGQQGQHVEGLRLGSYPNCH